MKNIKTFMDFTCPFSYIGFTILDKLRKENLEIEYIWYPYILNRDTPVEGSEIDRKFDKEKKEEIFKRLENLGSEYSLHYNNKLLFFNTNRAHKAALFARDQGKLYEFSKEVFFAVFEKGDNIAKTEVLNEISYSLGLDVEDMNKKIDNGMYDEEMKNAEVMAKKYKIRSVPTFIIDDHKEVTDLKKYKEFKEDLLN